jgi:hypothetical protein
MSPQPKYPDHPNYNPLGPRLGSGAAVKCVWCASRIAPDEPRHDVTVKGAPKGMPDQVIHADRCADAFLRTRRTT